MRLRKSIFPSPHGNRSARAGRRGSADPHRGLGFDARDVHVDLILPPHIRGQRLRLNGAERMTQSKTGEHARSRRFGRFIDDGRTGSRAQM